MPSIYGLINECDTFNFVLQRLNVATSLDDVEYLFSTALINLENKLKVDPSGSKIKYISSEMKTKTLSDFIKGGNGKCPITPGH